MLADVRIKHPLQESQLWSWPTADRNFKVASLLLCFSDLISTPRRNISRKHSLPRKRERKVCVSGRFALQYSGLVCHAQPIRWCREKGPPRNVEINEITKCLSYSKDSFEGFFFKFCFVFKSIQLRYLKWKLLYVLEWIQHLLNECISDVGIALLLLHKLAHRTCPHVSLCV